MEKEPASKKSEYKNLERTSRKDYLKVSQLKFDSSNPRFPAEIASGPTAELIERFIRDERLLEIITSIADQGYFEGEPLLVVQEDEKFIVIEGNRRLAALKLLSNELKPPEGRISIEEVCDTAKFKPDTVPCLIFEHADQILRYLGFRHITGIKAWGPLQKARYIKKIRDRFYANFEGKDQLTHLAREIGSRADYVGQVLASLNLYERAEKVNFYNVTGLNPEEIEFSILSTALGYKNIVAYIGLESRQDLIGENVSDENLENILTWMFVARSNQKPVLGDSRNLSKLAAIVDSVDATALLKTKGDLDEAFQLSKGPAQALNLALQAIERKLKEVWQWLPMVENPDPGDEEIADEIRKLAASLRDAIKMKRNSTDE